MLARYRVSYAAFTRLSDIALIPYLQTVVICLTGNVPFASLAELVAELGATLAAFEVAVDAMTPNTTPQLTAERDEARVILLDVARKTGAAVQSIALNSLSLLLSTGFINTNPPSPQTELDTPVINSTVNFGTTKALLSVTSVANAKSYEIQLSTDGGKTWVSGGTSATARRIQLNNLVPTVTYAIQVRAIGGSTGQSLWSMSYTLMAN